MKQQILTLIQNYDSIIIHRHTRPDMDAIGSQMGLKYLINENYPSKKKFMLLVIPTTLCIMLKWMK